MTGGVLRLDRALVGGAIASEIGLRAPFVIEGVAISVLTGVLAARLLRDGGAV